MNKHPNELSAEIYAQLNKLCELINLANQADMRVEFNVGPNKDGKQDILNYKVFTLLKAN